MTVLTIQFATFLRNQPDYISPVRGFITEERDKFSFKQFSRPSPRSVTPLLCRSSYTIPPAVESTKIARQTVFPAFLNRTFNQCTHLLRSIKHGTCSEFEWLAPLIDLLNTTTRMLFEILFVMLIRAIVFPRALGIKCFHENENTPKYSCSCTQLSN